MSEPYYESPLAHVAEPPGLYVSIREIPDRGMIDLRGLPGDNGFMAAARQVLGVDLPTRPRTSVSWGDIKVLWLSIDQWLILCPRAKAPEVIASLKEALRGIHSLVVDVSDMRAIIRIEGDGMREVLMKGCSLDLLSGDYGAGTVRRMRFAEIAALLHVIEEDICDIYVFRSYASYAWDYLQATAREPSRVRLFGKQAAPV
ncbi:MAG: hypothetical protein KDK89_08930 [Alphaproteobacteria bacterium]|nr:hypothetical protein [Alphaproteobacteria bacterium]